MARFAAIFAIVLTTVIIFGTSTLAWGAQLDARFVPESEDAAFTIKFQRTVIISFPGGGNVADELANRNWIVERSSDFSDPGVQDLVSRLNNKISSDGSGARITDMNVDYSARFTGRASSASIDYKVILSATLSDFTVRSYSANSPALIDMGWRGLSVQGPVTIDGVEINMPISVLASEEPTMHSYLLGSEAAKLLSMNIINSEGIKKQPLGNWHFLFDPTGINVDASTFGLSKDISGFVVSSFTMGESSFREGIQTEKSLEATFVADKQYSVKSIESADSGNIFVVGFAAVDKLDGVEFFGVSPTTPEGYATTSTGEFPVMIIYGMAGLAGIGAVAILFMSSRKLKAEEKQGHVQTGIDPSQLQAYQTSAGSGGYQTNRGEAQLTGNAQYQQTKNVYEQEKKAEPSTDSSTSQSSKGSMPKGWKPK